MPIYRLTNFDENVTALEDAHHAGGHLLAEDPVMPEHVYAGDPVMIMPASADEPAVPVQLCTTSDYYERKIALRVGDGPVAHVNVVELLRAIALSSGTLQCIDHSDGVHLVSRTARAADGQSVPYTLAHAAQTERTTREAVAAQEERIANFDMQAFLEELDLADGEGPAKAGDAEGPPT